MNKIIAFSSTLGIVLFFSALNGNAQGRGQGHAPVAGAPVHGAGADHGQSRVSNDGHGEHVRSDKQSDKQTVKDTDIAGRISRNSELNDRIAKLLPAGMNLKTASTGFKNQGQFIAALHVSKNLDIPFDQLKAKMTGSSSDSVGRAIHELRPAMTEKQVETEAKKA